MPYAFSEDITSHGVKFHVDVLRSTGAGYSTVGVGSHQELVEDKKIPEFVTQAYFSDRELFRLIDMPRLKAYVLDAVAHRNLSGSVAALKALFEFGDSVGQESIELFESLSVQPAVSDIFKPLLESATLDDVSPRILSICLVAIGRADLEAVRTRFTRLLYAHADSLRTYLREKLLLSLHDGKIDEAELYTSIMKDFFTSDDPEVKSFQVLNVKLHQLVQGGNEVESTLSDLSGSDPILKRYLAPLVLETIHKKSKEFLATGQSDKALLILSQVDQDKRTPLTHSLTAEALKALPATSRVLLDVTKVQDFADKVASKDPFVREAYFNALERLMLDRVSQDLVKDAQAVLKLVSKARQDPNTLNDALRIEAALVLLRAEKKQDAKVFLDQVTTGIPVLSRLQIVWIKIYTERVLVCIVLVGVILLLLSLKFLPNIVAAFSTKKESQAEPEEDEEEEKIRPVFVSAGGGRSGGLPHEYLEALYELGLEGGATLKDIKTAYRNKIKDIHPDHNQQDTSNDAEFLRIKDVYERTLEIRKRLGIE